MVMAMVMAMAVIVVVVVGGSSRDGGDGGDGPDLTLTTDEAERLSIVGCQRGRGVQVEVQRMVAQILSGGSDSCVGRSIVIVVVTMVVMALFLTLTLTLTVSIAAALLSDCACPALKHGESLPPAAGIVQGMPPIE